MNLDLNLESYDFDLPEELIAQEPLADRASSRLFHLPLDGGVFAHRTFRDLPDLLEPGDLLVLNNTRVTAARLTGVLPTGQEAEALVMKETRPGEFEALLRPAKKMKVGERVEFKGGIVLEVVEVLPDGSRVVRFPGVADPAAMLSEVGQVPLPPYITQTLSEPERYQTVYAHQGGSAAAPTAGLHFTSEIFRQLAEKDVNHAFVTLDVGIDTFRPIKVESVENHVMHGETCRISPETAEAINRCKGRVIAVGTTSARTLESFATGSGRVEPGEKNTQIFLYPGYEMKVVRGLVTNFHLPRTTMLLMLAAMVGRERLLDAYEEAIREKYRMLSFGDSMILL